MKSNLLLLGASASSYALTMSSGSDEGGEAAALYLVHALAAILLHVIQ